MIAVLMATYLTFEQAVHVEPDPIKRSRFIADGAPVSNPDEALAFVDTIRKQYPDAGHHCFAWRLAEGDQGFRVSDDGEPGGTAGQPILNHIDGAQLRGVVIVVTRYFGGTKLGKGGLVRAYGGTAGEAIKAAQVISVVETESLRFTFRYGDLGIVEGVLRNLSVQPAQSDYGSQVSMTVSIPTEQVEDARNRLTDATAGRIEFD